MSDDHYASSLYDYNSTDEERLHSGQGETDSDTASEDFSDAPNVAITATPCLPTPRDTSFVTPAYCRKALQALRIVHGAGGDYLLYDEEVLMRTLPGPADYTLLARLKEEHQSKLIATGELIPPPTPYIANRKVLSRDELNDTESCYWENFFCGITYRMRKWLSHEDYDCEKGFVNGVAASYDDYCTFRRNYMLIKNLRLWRREHASSTHITADLRFLFETGWATGFVLS